MNRNPAELHSLAAESVCMESVCIQLVYEWASCEMPTIDTWKEEEGYGTCPHHDWLIWQMNEMQITGSPVIPDSVRDQIEYQFSWISEKVTDWICYHHRRNFFHDEPASSLKEYLLKLVWKPNRSIDYTETAKNILTSSNFNAMERYRFACTYCFPEEVWNLKDMAKIAMDWCFKKEPLLVYWSKYLTNQLHTITLPAAYASIDMVMFREAVEKLYPQEAVEYFFTKFNNSGIKIWQYSEVIANSKILHGKKYLKELLSLMNECEKRLVYQDNAIQIVKNLIWRGDYEGISLMCCELKGKSKWTNLPLIIVKLVKKSISIYFVHFNPLSSLLLKVWNDAIGKDGFLENVRDLQSRIATECSTEIVSSKNCIKYSRSIDAFHRPLEFIRALAAAHEPRNFLKSNFYWLVIWQPFASIVELIDEFQLNAEDVEELKMHTRHPSRMRCACLKYLENGKLDEFSAFVSFCYSGHNADMSAYQKDLLIDEDGLKALADALNHIDWKIVIEFVNNVFRDNAGFASGYTTRLLFRAFQNGDEMYEFLRKIMQQEDAMNGIVDCIQTFVPGNDNLSLAKEAFVDLLLKALHDDVDFFVFKRAAFNENTLNWCYGTETGVAEFKEMINVSEVFIAQFWGCMATRTSLTFEVSDSMEEFLHWYYPIDSERRAFKLEMIHSYNESEAIALQLKDRLYRRRMLDWFLENDADAITEFLANVSSIKFSG
ncbi:uncharacterized protein LOC135837924 [Planococcus citri]|uniref:uncharacterized protein LOC135837924 n=1 Tax=Planococcus citri TaxID=170843 RepID=UPI0031F845C1